MVRTKQSRPSDARAALSSVHQSGAFLSAMSSRESTVLGLASGVDPIGDAVLGPGLLCCWLLGCGACILALFLRCLLEACVPFNIYI
jgi:hypothetical protein